MARSNVPNRERGRARRSRATRGFFTLGEVARAVGGRVSGDSALRLTGVSTLEAAGPGDLSWVADEGHVAQGASSRAGALLVASTSLASGKPSILVKSPVLALARWLELHRAAERPRAGIARGAFVTRTARLAAGVSIAAGATVAAEARVGARTIISAGAFVGERAEIGEDCVLHPNSAVLAGCRVGSRCILQPGAVVGSDGFGYVWDGQAHRKIPQIGIVRLEDDVEIGANAAIDRATLGETVIGRGSKIDNLVQVGHNVIIGEHSILCGQAGIGGSSRLGRGVTLAGQVGISDHVSIGDGAILTGQAGVARKGRVPAGAVLSGMPALPHREFLKRAALVGRLEAALARLTRLEERLSQTRKGGEPWSSGSTKS
ncbi:MAG TPA: UDP-3-O-(3-hydroxymyristoyl)glucosamine N-acyltransferase [Thermoanaerobaculia bacterium]